jgi:D-arabinose 5-phosphate isomerase GutQ
MAQVSTGTKAVFLSPTDALHGDIGIVGEADLLVAFSKSGGSEELLKLLPFAKVPADAREGITDRSPVEHACWGPPSNRPLRLKRSLFLDFTTMVTSSAVLDMQAKGATLVSVTSVAGCKLESVCDLAVVLPLVRDKHSHSGL